MTVGVKVCVCVYLVYVYEQECVGRCDSVCVCGETAKASVTLCTLEDSREGQHHSCTLQRSQTQADTRKDTPNIHMPHSQSWGHRLAFCFIFMLLCYHSVMLHFKIYISWTANSKHKQ